MDQLATEVLVWWLLMSLLGVINIVLWGWLYRHLKSKGMTTYDRAQLLLCGIYVFGCASRCFIVRSDVVRFAMIDSWVANVLVGRSIATLAEVAFVAQWALLLLWLAGRSKQPKVRALALVLVPLILVAETASWYGVTTTNYIGQTIEESLWAFTAALFLIGLLICRKTAPSNVTQILRPGVLLCCGYILFMICIDVPNYYHLWQTDQSAGKVYLTLSQGFEDMQHMTVTGRLADWRYPMVWMSLYFSIAVWISLAIVFLPFRMMQNRPETSQPS